MSATPSINGSFQLASGEVHSWCATLNVPPETCARFNTILACDERDRSARFRFERDRRRFIVARGVLRTLLGRYLGTDPGCVRFTYNAYGKPELSPEFGSWLKFNLSHSADLALIAIAARADVGIDLEHIRALSDYDEIARHFFSATEVDHLNKSPRHLHARVFFSCWTKKEAYVKACGQGLALPLKSFSVPLSSDPAQIDRDRRWSLYTLQPAPGYLGALAIEGSGWRLAQRNWPMPAGAAWS